MCDHDHGAARYSTRHRDRIALTRLVGDIDLQGLLALADVPAGYQGIRIEMDIKAKNATDDELDELIGFAQAHSPVCNTVCRPVPVTVERKSR